MSTLKTNNVQVGQSVTATNNFTLYQPTVPDGTVRLGVGNTGATTLDAVTVTNAGNVSMPSLTVNSNNISAVNSMGFRNRIINGDMRIDQRNAGASVTPANGAYTLDRWAAFTNGAGVYTVQQSSTAPAGFTNSLLCTVTTIDSSVTGSDYYMLQHKVEGFNSADFAWGSASAASVTLSFWVRSSITGTYSVKLGNSASDRFYIATYTISAANTWEQKTITLSGDTSGTWVTNNGTGIEMRFGLAIGSSFTSSTIGSWAAGNSFGATTASNNWIGTNGATFYITGVQLEAGTVASPFERRPYGEMLMLCQRYYQHYVFASGGTPPGTGVWRSSTRLDANSVLPVVMRATPTIAVTNVGNIQVYDGGSSRAATGISDNGSTASNVGMNISVASGATEGRGGYLQASGATAGYTLSSEL
jgi:hypothetical protein